MQTESTNKLAELLEIDRGTMVRVLRNVPPDTGTKARPEWKVSTASEALEAHRRRGGVSKPKPSRNGDVPPASLQSLYDMLDRADKALRDLPTIAERRAAAVALIPMLERVDHATRSVGNAAGDHGTDNRASILYQMTLRGFESPCDWTTDETWSAMSKEQA